MQRKPIKKAVYQPKGAKKMKVKDKVMINEGIYKGVEAIITGFEHLNIPDDIVTVNSDPEDCSRVEIQSNQFTKHSKDLMKDNKLYYSVYDLKRCV